MAARIVEQQADLAGDALLAAAGILLLFAAAVGIVHLAAGVVAGQQRFAVHLAPVFERFVETDRGVVEHVLGPIFVIAVPARLLDLVASVDDAAGGFQRVLDMLAAFARGTNAFLERILGVAEVENVADAALVAADRRGRSHPDRVQVGADEFFVLEVDAGRVYCAGDHFFALLEEVLIVGVALGGEGQDQRRVAVAAGPAAALGVVGGGGRDIAQVDGVEVGDVYAELHRGGAEEGGQHAVAEAALALLAVFGADLARVRLGQHRAERRGRLAVELLEEGIRLFRFRVKIGQVALADGVFGHGSAVALGPAHRAGVDADAAGAAAVVLGGEQMAAQLVDDALGQFFRAVGAEVGVAGPDFAGAEEAADGGAVAERERGAGLEAAAFFAGQQRQRLPAHVAGVGLVQRPGLAQPLGGVAGQAAQRFLRQRGRVDGELGAEAVEDRVQDGFALLGIGFAHQRHSLPAGIVRGELVQALVGDAEQASLFEVGLVDAPAAGEVFERSVLEQVDHRALALLVAGAARDRVLEEVARREFERIEDALAEFGEAERAVLADGLGERGTQQRDLHEVVEVPGLQRSILPVIGETERLCCYIFHVLLFDAGDCGVDCDGGRR